MSITVELPGATAEYLRENAAQQGLNVDQYLSQSLAALSLPHAADTPLDQLSEPELLQRINLAITPQEWDTYRQLLVRRDAGTLTESERQELLFLTNRVEVANARRMRYVGALAQRRGVDLDVVMAQLGIKPFSHD